MSEVLKYDMLKLYFGENYYLTDEITIYQPTIGQIIDYGETEFWEMAYTLTANPTSMKLPLWKSGIDWNDMDEFMLFSILVNSIPSDKTNILFGDLDFTKFKTITRDDKSIVMIYMPNPIIQIDKKIYLELVGYLRVMLNIHPKVQKAKNKFTKELLIEEERKKIEIEKKTKKENHLKSSILFPLISAALNHPGFKYKKNELKEVGIVEFMDSINRLTVYEEVTSLMTGIYMGMIDTKKINLNKELNWVRDIYD